jgi:predicted ABC-type transport system involved in lysophospholipase L1 biosynthesis ATPase subunit
MSLLELERVGQRGQGGREEIIVLDDVSLSIEAGDTIGIQGERRSGKSALLRIIAGWERPTQGRAVFDGDDMWALSDGQRAKLRRRGGVGLAAGWWRPNTNKPTVHHVQEALASDGYSLREAEEPALSALDRAGLANCAYTPSSTLTQAELIRLSLAQRLVHLPRLLLVDEPAVLLRPSEALELYELLAELGRDTRLALVIASEELAPIRTTERVFSLDRGTLRAMDSSRGRLLEFPPRRSAAAGS